MEGELIAVVQAEAGNQVPPASPAFPVPERGGFTAGQPCRTALQDRARRRRNQAIKATLIRKEWHTFLRGTFSAKKDQGTRTSPVLIYT